MPSYWGSLAAGSQAGSSATSNDERTGRYAGTHSRVHQPRSARCWPPRLPAPPEPAEVGDVVPWSPPAAPAPR